MTSRPDGKKMMVYVAGPYTDPDPVENTHDTIQVGLDLWETGLVVPVIPHLTLLAHLVRPAPYDYWLAFDKDQLLHCHALLRLAGASSGADQEVQDARNAGIPVFYNVADLLAFAADWSIVTADINLTVNEEAEGLINGHRHATYGHPLDDFGRTAGILTALLGVEVTAQQVPLIMIAVKMSRLSNGYHRDSNVDISGYSGTLEMVVAEQERRASMNGGDAKVAPG